MFARASTPISLLFALSACVPTGTLELPEYADDDDIIGDDDDTTGDDDDTTGDDDDTTAGDDDDDSTPARGPLEAGPDSIDFGATVPGAALQADAAFRNLGQISVSVELSIEDPAGAGAFQIAGPPSFAVAGGQELVLPLLFIPLEPDAYQANLVVVHDADNESPIRIRMFGRGEGVEDDDDSTDGDVCCSPGDEDTWMSCADQAAIDCVCAADPWCCSTGWDQMCIEVYVGLDNQCPGAATCGDVAPGGGRR